MQRLSLALILLLGAGLPARGQELARQKIEMRLDAIGDAWMTVSETMNAARWQTWVQSVGNNPAVLKRAMERALPAYFLDGFRLEKDDMARSYTLTFRAYGVCKVDRRGRWSLDTEQKDPEITQLSDRRYMAVHTDLEIGAQQTQIIDFPEAAEDIRVAKDAFGKTRFEFEMASPGGGRPVMLWLGVALTLAGLGMMAGKRARGAAKPEPEPAP